MSEALELLIAEAMPGVLASDETGARALPRTSLEVAALVRHAHACGAVLALPGASSRPGALRVELARMRAVTIDETSRIACAQGGATLAEVEQALEAGGSTLALGRHAALDCDVAGWLASGAPGARDPADDPVDQLIAGAEVVLPNGEIATLRPAPRRAVGPDWLSAIVGARGRLGVVTAAHLVARASAPTRTLAFELRDQETAERSRIMLRGLGVRPRATTIATDPARAWLVLELAGPTRLLDAWETVAARIVAELRGRRSYTVVELAAPEPSVVHDAPPPTVAPIVEALARALDPARVLG